MTRHITNPGMIDERLQRLETQCTRLKLALIALPLAAGILGAAAADIADWKGKSVTTEKLTLVDANGRARAVLQVGTEGPTFALLNDDQSPLVSVGKSKSTRVGVIYFYDDRGNFATQEGGRRLTTN
jgi:hypothetical protein